MNNAAIIDALYHAENLPRKALVAALKRRQENCLVMPGAPVLNEYKSVGRNDPCPCSSRKKYKKCCLQ